MYGNILLECSLCCAGVISYEGRDEGHDFVKQSAAYTATRVYYLMLAKRRASVLSVRAFAFLTKASSVGRRLSALGHPRVEGTARLAAPLLGRGG